MRNILNKAKNNIIERAQKSFYNLYNTKDRLKTSLATERKGAVAFEYIIILVFMVVIIVAAWNILQPVILAKVAEVKDAIDGANPGSGTRP